MAANFTNQRAQATVDAVREEIEGARKNGYNVLITEDVRLASEMFLPHLSVLHLSADVDDGDFYFPNDAKGKGRITYSALKKLAAEAGIEWMPEQEGIVTKDSDYVAFRAVGRRFTSSGEKRLLAGFSDKDMLIKEEDLRAKNETDKYKKTEAQIKAELRKERGFWMRKAESGARARVIRGFIPVKAAYTVEEIKKPWVILRYIFSPDMRDELIKRQCLQAGLQAMGGVYGPQAVAALPAAQPEQIHDADFSTLPADAQDFPEAPNLAEQPPAHSLEDDFKLLDAEEQTATIKRLIEKTGYNTANRPAHLKKPAADYTAADRLDLYKILTDVGF